MQCFSNSKVLEFQVESCLVISHTKLVLIPEDVKNSTKYWICKKAFEKDEVKVKYHDHVTGKYQGSPHQECNLNPQSK